MASSGSKSVSVTSYDTLKFTWTEKSQSIENNTTTISWALQLISDSSGAINSSAEKSWSVTVNGTKYSGKNTVGISASTTKTLASGSTTISHNSDGTKTFAYSFSQEFSITFSGSNIGTKSGSGTGVLDTIPRKSTLTVGNGTLGTAQTLTISRNSSSFTHTITYTCGSASGTIATKSSSTSISFTPPISLSSQNAEGTSVSIKYTLTTYNGDTNLGSNSYTKTCAIPASVKPSCSLSISDAAGYYTEYGSYIKGLSKLAVTVTATTSYGSAINSYVTTANGSRYTSKTFTTGVLKASGSQSITTTITDKRGRTATATTSYTAIDYAPPNITALSVHRCNQDGTDNVEGSYISVKFSCNISALDNKNSASYQIKYKKTTDSSYTTVSLTDYDNQYTVTNLEYIFEADTSYSYDITVSATDNFKTSSKSDLASTGFALMHWKANGRGMGIGKLSEIDDAIEIAFKIYSTYGHVIYSPVELSEGQDLNALLDVGYYTIGNTTISATIQNKPPWLSDTSTAHIEVLRMGEGMQICQRYYVCSKDIQLIFQRVYYSNSWGDWMIVSGCTGWRNLTISSGFETYRTETTPKYRINGNFVSISGAVSPTSIVTSNTTLIPFATGIAELYRPTVNQQFVCHGSGINKWLLSVATDGSLNVSRYGTNEYVDIPVGAWLTFTVSYSI